MLRVDRIVVREIHLPLKEPFEISSGVTTNRRILILELRHPNGVSGWSECVAPEEPNYCPETTDTAWLAITKWVAPQVLGRDFSGPEEIHSLLERSFRGHPMAKAAVEMGIWELYARLRGEPLSLVLEGTKESVPVGISLGIQDRPESLVERAAAAWSQGYRKIKIKIRPGADFEFVAAVRSELGPHAPLMADANSAYSMEQADRLLRLDELDLMMIEQPLHRQDLLRHAELQKLLKTPICLDESIDSPDRAEDMISLAAGRIVNIKAGRVGGFTPSLAIHDCCEQAGLPVWAGGMLESGVGRAHNVALASLPNFSLPGDLSPSSRYWERDIVSPEWTMEPDGTVRVPLSRPGMGVEVDMDRVEDLTARKVVLR
jgi:O-succinylbenzoate synthase